MANISTDTENARCHNVTDVVVHPQTGQPVTTAVMFSAGVLGNIVALVLLRIRRRRSSPSLYRVLVTALLLTDLLGSVSVSPVVLSAYAQKRTLVAMGAHQALCLYFGFSMTFFSLSTLSILCVLALERYFSIGQPYFYERHASKCCGYITIALIYVFSILFCIPPFLGFGQYVQYCPGTWCFLQLSGAIGNNKVYIGFYASAMLIITSTTVVCNLAVVFLLAMMYRRGKVRRSGVSAQTRYLRSRSMTEEVAHLLPQTIITVVFICCTFPFVVQVYIHLTASQKESHIAVNKADHRALLLLSFHPIINPWVFIIVRPTVVKTIWRRLHKSRRNTLMMEKTPSPQSGCCAAPEAGQRERQWTWISYTTQGQGAVSV